MPRKHTFRRRPPINLSRAAFAQLAAALGIAVICSASRGAWNITTADFKDHALVTINTWNPAEGLSFTDQSGKLNSLPTRNIVSLSSGSKISDQAGSTGWKLTLRNGDVLFGTATGMSGKSLLFKEPEIGVLAIPLKRVGTLSAPVFGNAAATGRVVKFAASDRDVVVFKTGDRISGLVTALSDSKLQLIADSAAQPADLELSRINYVLFGGPKTQREVPPLSVRLTLVSGSVFTIPLAELEQPFNWKVANVTIKDPAGREHVIDADRIATIDLLGGRIVQLSELDPIAEEQTSFLGTQWPSQINRNVLGQPMRVGRTNYPRGIGVHTQSLLAYELDGSFDTLAIRVGLDDSAAPHGEAKARIVLDGKTLWESKVLKPGEISEELSLPIKGGKRLELHADPASRLDVQGRVNWINAALRRD